jgi:hypothetical protein
MNTTTTWITRKVSGLLPHAGAKGLSKGSLGEINQENVPSALVLLA